MKTVRLWIFLTSRPEILIRNGFTDVEHKNYVLHRIAPLIVDHDISIFLRHELGLVGQKLAFGNEWPDAESIKRLAQKSSGLFIWAATVCRFINEGIPEERLRTILGSVISDSAPKEYINEAVITFLQKVMKMLIWNAGTISIWAAIACGLIRETRVYEERLLKFLKRGALTPEYHLDILYTTILRSSIRPTFTRQEAKIQHNRLRNVLGSIVVLFSPLSIQSLRELLHCDIHHISQTLQSLHAILDIPESLTDILHLHHPSFRDFLLSKDRCGDFWVDERETHHILAAKCIHLMSQTLKKDICGLHAPGYQATQVKSSRIQRCLPAEVQYACLYWIQHLQRSGNKAYDGKEAHRFLQAHLLHWLEALSLMGKISEGILAISFLQKLILVSFLLLLRIPN